MAEKKAFLLRIDPALHDALSRWAADELRSVNGQIEFLLRAALAESGRWKGGGARPAPGSAPADPGGAPGPPPARDAGGGGGEGD